MYYIQFTRTAEKTDKELWDDIVAEVKSSDKYGIKNQWNARKASYAVTLYKERGGEYKGKKPNSKNNSLKKWLKEEWTTYDGKPAIQKDEQGKVIQVNRYLPKEAWDTLSPQQVGATNRIKRKGFQEGKQFVPNAKDAKEAGSKARKFSYME